jgi:hypothetical protein
MKHLLLLFILSGTALAVQVGDSYDSVIAEKGKPRSQMEAGSVRMLTYPDMVVKLADNSVVSIRPLKAAPADAPRASAPQQPMTAQDRAAALQKLLKETLNKVILIVNQPVQGVPRTDDMKLSWFGNGWFQPGASIPDFDHADVRQTQDTSQYTRFDYVASNLAPDVAYLGSDLEFNPALKLFYQDKTVPKKKLSEGEMIEINRLFRVIGECNRELGALGYR